MENITQKKKKDFKQALLMYFLASVIFVGVLYIVYFILSMPVVGVLPISGLKWLWLLGTFLAMIGGVRIQVGDCKIPY